jgi:triosephosphate isomerase
MDKPRPLVAGNWKMNGLSAALGEASKVVAYLAGPGANTRADVMICPPYTLLNELASVSAGSPLQIGAQDCHMADGGAHTGDVSASMLADVGVQAIIVGHSERRTDHGEVDRTVQMKAAAAHAAGLAAIICVGETAAEREAGKTLDVVQRQLLGSLPAGTTSTNTVIAYEPVWAIGSGLVPTGEDVAQVHAALRKALQDQIGAAAKGLRLLYGGSVKPQNANELMAIDNVDGALVGGASLKADDFIGIISAYQSA